jgi:sterol desaturase/sphingolipid hydroxylase (fatty acid hydroxylase superfamily)
VSDLLAFAGSALFDAVAAFVVLAAIFVPLEKAYPATQQASVHDGSRLDLAFFLGQQFCFGFLILAALGWLRPHVDALPLQALREAFHSQPLPLCVLEALMLGDLFAYWGHRAQHRYEWLWRFHRVHHSSTRLDWLAAHPEHPLDGLYTQTLINLPLLVLGFSFRAAAGVVVFRAVWAVLIHANVRLPLGPLGFMFGSPELHHLHHARDREAINFGNLAPWTDRVFGTHARSTEPSQEALGLPQPLRGGYLRMLLEPLVGRAGDGPKRAPQMGRSCDVLPRVGSSVARASGPFDRHA